MNSARPTWTILLIGGSGFVSGEIARTAIAAGHKVWAVTRGRRPLPEGVLGVKADRKNSAGFAEVVASAGTRWDLVVDCVGFEPEDARQDVSLFRERARQFVFISTDFVFDPARRRFPQPEESEHYLAADSVVSAGYGGKKRLCELEFIRGDAGRMEWTIFRPCHIYGPGSELGCFPFHGRDPELIRRMKAGERLRLVAGGIHLQQPIFSRDLAELILSAAGNRKAYKQVYQAAGPEIVESRRYYQIIGEILGVETRIEDYPADRYLAENPPQASFICHRIYDLAKIRAHGLKTPATPLEEGLREQVGSLLREQPRG